MAPWRAAVDIDYCQLYWLPVTGFPVNTPQRVWLMAFLDLWAEAMKAKFQLRIEQFLSMKVIQPALTRAFTNWAREFKPIPGLTWFAVARAPKSFTLEQIEELQNGARKFDFSEHVDDQVYWFVNKAERQQREQFFGHGGMTILYMKPDAKTKPPALPISASRLRGSSVYGSIFEKFDLEQTIAEAYALRDPFLTKSRELFSSSNPSDDHAQEAQFAVPVLSSGDFFSASQTCMQWFELFDVYLTESPGDRGILLASKQDIKKVLIALIEKMRNDGMDYPE